MDFFPYASQKTERAQFTECFHPLLISFQGNSPQAMSLAKGIQQKLHELEGKVARAVQNTERSGVRKPAYTLDGKVDQGMRWCQNPGLDDGGLGKHRCQFRLNDASMS